MLPPYLSRISVVSERVDDPHAHPFDIPALRHLDLRLDSAVTFFVGENGSGKSTLMEGIAELARLPVSGGGREELADRTGPESRSALGPALRPGWHARPPDAFFFRGEHMVHFSELLDRRRDDPDFVGAPYGRYGGGTLSKRSHGEGFLDIFVNRLDAGLFLMDEPEAALSPQRQLMLLARMAMLVDARRTQLIIATHSPILLTFPHAIILSFDGDALRRVSLEETSHYQITRGILESPERYWKHLREG